MLKLFRNCIGKSRLYITLQPLQLNLKLTINIQKRKSWLSFFY